MKLELIRTYHPGGTNGELLLDGDRISSCIELPWKNNAPRISCIPEGEYLLKKRWSRRFGHHFVICNVPGRSAILLHPANDALKELKGCIAPVSLLTGEGRGSSSRIALAALERVLDPFFEKGEPILLTIKPAKDEQADHKDEQADA